MKILLGDLNAKVGKEDIFKLTIWNESLHEISNRNLYKYTFKSPDGKTHKQIDHILIDKRSHSSVLDVLLFRAADCDTGHYPVVANISEGLAMNRQRSQRFQMKRFNRKKLN
jgi:endonuclease/exonuclease/phosphatase family metal-dependent hydrolase